jgi:hypothetical protein
MSDKLLWSSVVIKVPSDFISVNSKGKIFIKPPLTKNKNIAKSKGQPAIKIITDDTINSVEIAEQGEYRNASSSGPRVVARKEIRKKADKKLVKKYLDNIETTMQPVDKKKKFIKGSEEAKEFMRQLREKRGKK